MSGNRPSVYNGSPRTTRIPAGRGQRPAKPVEFPPKKTQAELAYELDRAWGRQG
jgi:hypothetical protein